MERPVRARLNTQIYEEACEWFIECRAGDLDDAARSELDRWLRKSPEHQSAYLEIAAIWNEGPTLDPTNTWDLDALIAQAAEDRGNIIALERICRPVLPAPRAITEEPETTLRTNALVLQPAGKAGRRVGFVAVAASILLVAALLGVYLFMPSGVYASALGEQRSLVLNDGSTIQLNSLSKIRVRFSEHERAVDLVQGQALFHVAKDSARPFVVYSDQTRVRAVGTQFDVYRRVKDTVVTVVEGRVAVIPPLSALDRENPSPDPDFNSTLRSRAHRGESGERNFTSRANTAPGAAFQREGAGEAGSPRWKSASSAGGGESESGNSAPGSPSAGTIFLAAGEQITVTPGAARRTPHPNMAGAIAWTERQLIFDSAPIADVAAEFNRYNERKLIIASSALDALHVSGVFSSTDPASLIRFLRDRPGLRVTETSTEIRVSKEP